MHLNRIRLSIFLVNAALLVASLELVGRIYQVYTINKAGSPWKSGFLSHYLKHVNHPRDLDYNTKEQHLAPLNWNRDTIFAFSCYSNCEHHSNKDIPGVILQGDSWGELLERFGARDIFRDFQNQKVSLLGGGTTSFSPSNFRAQLNYFKYHLGTDPQIVIAYIDQTDIGDEYYRYKRKQSTLEEGNRSLPVVLPFDVFEHFAYFNFNHIPRQSSLVHKPAFVWLLENSIARALKKFDESRGWKMKLTSTPDWKTISKPLYGNDYAAEEYFIDIMLQYISNAQSLGVRELIIVSHPHMGHIEGKNKVYAKDVGDLIDKAIRSYKSNYAHSRVHHLRVESAPNICTDDSCGGYFVPGDWASHPQPRTIPIIARSIRNFMIQKKIAIR